MEKVPVATSNKYLEILLQKWPSHESEFARRHYFPQKDTRYKGNPPPFTAGGAEFSLFSSATAALMDYKLIMRPFIWGLSPHQQEH